MRFRRRVSNRENAAVSEAADSWPNRPSGQPGPFAGGSREYFGDAGTILQRIADYVDQGLSKFVLRPVGRGDEVIEAQTRQLIDKVLPEVARRWPKKRKAA